MSVTLLDVLPPLFAVGFTLCAVLSARDTMNDHARSRRAVRTDGTVLSVRFNSEQQVFPLVRFRTATGQVVEAEPSSTSNFARFHVGQPVWLRYDPQDPTWIRVDGLPGGTVVGVIVTAAMMVVAVVCAAVTLLRL